MIPTVRLHSWLKIYGSLLFSLSPVTNSESTKITDHTKTLADKVESYKEFEIQLKLHGFESKANFWMNESFYYTSDVHVMS